MLAQRRAAVAPAKDPAALELGHDEADDVLVGAGRMGRGDHEAVARAAVEPRLHLIGDVGACADERGPCSKVAR